MQYPRARSAGTNGQSNGGCGEGLHCAQPPGTFYCWWGPSQLLQMMQQQQSFLTARPTAPQNYNEVILSGPHWASKLPAIIQAVWYQPDNADARAYATKVHADFMRAYGLDRAAVPLLQLDTRNAQVPFTVA